MKLAIFDIDGTLTDTNNVDEECFIKAFSEVHSVAYIDTDWALYPHTTDSGIAFHIFQTRFGRNPSEIELETFKSCFVNMLAAQYQYASSSFAEIAGAALALSFLRRDSEWAVAIATGCWLESALLKLNAAGVDTDGMPVACAEDGLSREEILQAAVLRALKQYQANNFEKVVSIGDGVWDVRTARNLNFAFLGVGCGETAVRLRQAGATHVLENFSDYQQLVRLLGEAQVPNQIEPAKRA